MALKVASGSYTGNGTSQSITGLGFQPKIVFIKADTINVSGGIMSIDTMPSGNGAYLSDNDAMHTSCVSSFDTDGFSVSTNVDVNQNTTTYRWAAFGGDSTDIATGSFTGNGSSQTITGLSFQPGTMFLMCSRGGASSPILSTVSGTALGFRDISTQSSSITSFNSDGFSVGSNANANNSGSTSYWAAIKITAGSGYANSYSGTGSSNSITAPNFQPEFVLTKGGTNRTAWRGSGAHTSTNSDAFVFNITNPITTGITSLDATGFTVSTSGYVNTSSTTYYYVAVKTSSASASQIKTWDGVTQANVKNFLGATNAQTKTWDGVSNV